jgi:hypothetical protein
MSILFYILGAMWAIGSLSVGACMVNDTCNSRHERVVGWLILLPFWAIVGVGPLELIRYESGPELATLLRSEWHCSAAHQETSTTYVKSGDVLVPMTSTSNVCDQYGRN